MSQLEPGTPRRGRPTQERAARTGARAALARLSALGQSVWVDFLSREALCGGEIARLIAQDSVVGATSNPTIFQQAMSRAGGYGEQRLALAADGVSDPRTIFWRLASATWPRPAICSRPPGARAADGTATSPSRWTPATPTTRSRRIPRQCASMPPSTGRT